MGVGGGKMSNNSRQTQFSCRQNHGSSQNPGLSHHAQDLSRQQQQHQHRRTYTMGWNRSLGKKNEPNQNCPNY